MKKITSKIVGYSLVSNEKSSKAKVEETIIPTDIKLPDDSPARMKVLKAEGKKWYLTVVYNNDSPFALFCHTNSHEKSAPVHDAVERLTELATKKGILKTHIDATIQKISADNNISKLTRIISLNLRHGVAIKNIVAELDKMDTIFVGSFLFQIKKFLSQYIKDGETVSGATCGDCGSTNLHYSEGCMVCADCGSSKCG